MSGEKLALKGTYSLFFRQDVGAGIEILAEMQKIIIEALKSAEKDGFKSEGFKPANLEKLHMSLGIAQLTKKEEHLKAVIGSEWLDSTNHTPDVRAPTATVSFEDSTPSDRKDVYLSEDLYLWYINLHSILSDEIHGEKVCDLMPKKFEVTVNGHIILILRSNDELENRKSVYLKDLFTRAIYSLGLSQVGKEINATHLFYPDRYYRGLLGEEVHSKLYETENELSEDQSQPYESVDISDHMSFGKIRDWSEMSPEEKERTKSLVLSKLNECLELPLFKKPVNFDSPTLALNFGSTSRHTIFDNPMNVTFTQCLSDVIRKYCQIKKLDNLIDVDDFVTQQEDCYILNFSDENKNETFISILDAFKDMTNNIEATGLSLKIDNKTANAIICMMTDEIVKDELGSSFVKLPRRKVRMNQKQADDSKESGVTLKRNRSLLREYNRQMSQGAEKIYLQNLFEGEVTPSESLGDIENRTGKPK